MAWLSTKPNVSGNEKARIEFHLQQIFSCVGCQPFLLPVVDAPALLDSVSSIQSLSQSFADHLSHDVTGLRIEVAPQPLEKCGGGG